MNALEVYVNELNENFCANTKNHLEIKKSMGLYQVVLTGKTKYQGLKERMFGITNGLNERELCKKNLEECVKYNWLQMVIFKYEFVT